MNPFNRKTLKRPIKPFSEAFPVLADAMRKNVGGRPKSKNPKVAV